MAVEAEFRKKHTPEAPKRIEEGLWLLDLLVVVDGILRGAAREVALPHPLGFWPLPSTPRP